MAGPVSNPVAGAFAPLPPNKQGVMQKALSQFFKKHLDPVTAGGGWKVFGKVMFGIAFPPVAVLVFVSEYRAVVQAKVDAAKAKVDTAKAKADAAKAKVEIDPVKAKVENDERIVMQKAGCTPEQARMLLNIVNKREYLATGFQKEGQKAVFRDQMASSYNILSTDSRKALLFNIEKKPECALFLIMVISINGINLGCDKLTFHAQ